MSATATQRFTEANRVDSGLIPVSRGAETYNTDYFSMRDFHKAFVLIQLGAIAATSTLNVSLQQAKDANGSGSKAFSPAKAITEITGTDDNKIVGIELDASELDVNNKFDYFRVQAVVAVDAATFGVVVIRHQPRYAPVGTSQFDEVVT